MPEVAKYFHNHNVTNMPRVKKSRHKSCTWVELFGTPPVCQTSLTTMALCRYSEIVEGSCGASSDNPENVQCVTYFLLTESEGRTGRILPEVVQERLRAIFSQYGPELARV